MERSAEKPGTSGTTTGRSSRDTKQRAGSSCREAHGRVSRSSGASTAWASRRAKTSRATAILSSGIGRPPSATWKTPAVVRRSLRGLCRTPPSTR